MNERRTQNLDMMNVGVMFWWGGGVSELYFYSVLHFSTQKTAQ